MGRSAPQPGGRPAAACVAAALVLLCSAALVLDLGAINPWCGCWRARGPSSAASAGAAAAIAPAAASTAPAAPAAVPYSAPAPVVTRSASDDAAAALVAQLPAALRSLPLDPPAPSNAVPKLLHNIYIGDWAAFLLKERLPTSTVRREWRTSCRAHHRNWTAVLWDERAGEALVRLRFPWFLPTWQSYKAPVMKADALRPLVLYTFGGVYMDMDIECYRPIDGSLAGASLVLQAEEPKIVNNGNLASTAGHPIWLALAARMVVRARMGDTNPPTATGPLALNPTFREIYSPPEVLPGEHTGTWASFHAAAAAALRAANITAENAAALPGAAGVDGALLLARVYPIGQWLTPCHQSQDKCMEESARRKPLAALRREIVGEQHFAATWMDGAALGAAHQSRARHLAQVAAEACARWFAEPSDFLSLTGCDAHGFCTSNASSAAAATSCAAAGGAWRQAGQHAWCDRAQPNAEGAAGAQCATLAVIADAGADEAKRTLAGLLRLPCQLTVVAASPHAAADRNAVIAHAKAATASSSGGPTPSEWQVRWHSLALAAADDPLAEPPEASLNLTVSLATQSGALPLHAVYVSAGETAWTALTGELAAGATTLRGAHALLLDLPAPPAAKQHVAYSAFQHLVQELGFLGVSHARLGDPAWPVAVTLQQLAMPAT